MSDLDNLLRVIARQTPLEWANNLASVVIIVAWTIYALSRGAM